MEDFECKFPRQIQFCLGWSSIEAVAGVLDGLYPHVFRATICDESSSFWHRLVRRWLPFLPSPLRRVVQTCWPRYALPPTFVVKKLKPPEKVDEDPEYLFDNEKVMYEKLAPIQGRTIPFFYGEGVCEGRRAFVLSYLPGVTLRRQTKPRFTYAEFQERIDVPLREMADHGVLYSDIKLSNAMLVDGRIMLVDLEWAEEMDPETLEKALHYQILEFHRDYQSYLPNADMEWY